VPIIPKVVLAAVMVVDVLVFLYAGRLDVKRRRFIRAWAVGGFLLKLPGLFV